VGVGVGVVAVGVGVGVVAVGVGVGVVGVGVGVGVITEPFTVILKPPGQLPPLAFRKFR
jgi:hypothetical protein